jgi:hypothetical protein
MMFVPLPGGCPWCGGPSVARRRCCMASVRSWAAELRIVTQATQARSQPLRVQVASIVAASRADAERAHGPAA